jgi:hypothetical protein
MVAKGQIAGTGSVPREPLVAEWRSDAVPMGGEGEGRKGAAPEGGFARRKGGGGDQRGIRTRTSDTMWRIGLGGNWPHLNGRGRLLLYRADWPSCTRQQGFFP